MSLLLTLSKYWLTVYNSENEKQKLHYSETSESRKPTGLCPLLAGDLKNSHIWDLTFCPLFMACPLFGMSTVGRFHCIKIFEKFFVRKTAQSFKKSADEFVFHKYKATLTISNLRKKLLSRFLFFKGSTDILITLTFLPLCNGYLSIDVYIY